MPLFIMYLYEFDWGHFDLTNFRTGVIYNNNENILNSREHLKIESRKLLKKMYYNMSFVKMNVRPIRL